MYLCAMIEERLDKILIQRGLVKTRGIAEKTIREIGVKVNGKLITKSGRKFSTDCIIELVKEDLSFSSIGAAKLEDAIKNWSLEITGKMILEIGCRDAFTEVLINHNAAKTYSIGLATNELDRVVSKHQDVVDLSDMMVREINSNTITDVVDGCVINQKTLSLKSVFPFVNPVLKSGGFVIALIHLELEVDKQFVSKTGFIKKKSLLYPTIQEIKTAGESNNLEYKGHITSPIIGESGNQEFLMFFIKK